MVTTPKAQQDSNITQHRGIRRRNIDADVMDAIYGSVSRELNGAAIHRALEARFGTRAPSLRTVQDVVRGLRPRDESEPWTLADAEDNSAAWLMEVLASAIERTNGGRRFLTKEEAQWLGKIHSSARDVPPGLGFELARQYIRRETRGEPTYDIDALIAFAPWRSDEHRARYWVQLIEQNLQPAPRYLHMLWLPEWRRGWTPLASTREHDLRVSDLIADLLAHDWVESMLSTDSFEFLDRAQVDVWEIQRTLASWLDKDIQRYLSEEGWLKLSDSVPQGIVNDYGSEVVYSFSGDGDEEDAGNDEAR